MSVGPGTTRLDAGMKPAANPAGSQRQPVRRRLQMRRESTAALDFRPLLAAIVFEDQSSFVRIQTRQAVVQAVQPLRSSLAFDNGSRRRVDRRFEPRDGAGVTPISLTEILEEHEFSRDVAVAGGRCIDDATLLLQAAGDAVQCLVSEVVRAGAALALEVHDQTSAHREIVPALGVQTLVEPHQQSAEAARRRRPVPFQLRIDRPTPFYGAILPLAPRMRRHVSSRKNRQRPGSRSRRTTLRTCRATLASRSETTAWGARSRYARATAGSRAQPPRIRRACSAAAIRSSKERAAAAVAPAVDALCASTSVRTASRMLQAVIRAW